MKVLEIVSEADWNDIANMSESGFTKILCIVGDCTPAAAAVKEIIRVLERHVHHDAIIISDDQLLVKLMKLQFDSQLRANGRYKSGGVLDKIKVLFMNIPNEAVSFATAFEPDVLIINGNTLLGSKHMSKLS